MIQSINPFAPAAATLLDLEAPKKKEQINIQVGSSNFLVDGIRNVLSIPEKILLLNSKFNSGGVSEETILKMRDFLHENGLHDVSISVNQYKPQEVWRRIFTNPKTSLLSKCTVGIAAGLFETLAIPKLTGYIGDHYSPLPNTVHLFSDDLAIALHECGHAKDFNERANPILYALTSRLPVVGPFLTLYQEGIATDNAIAHLRGKNLSVEVKHALKVLVPAYTTYCAAAILTNDSSFEYCLRLIGIVAAGHVIGRILAVYEPQTKPAQQVDQKLPASAAAAPAA